MEKQLRTEDLLYSDDQVKSFDNSEETKLKTKLETSSSSENQVGIFVCIF